MKDLKLLIVDEVSLLGSDMLYKIHLRLNEILQNDSPHGFGGISVILVGDLLQLAPVKAKYIFEEPKNSHFKAFHEVNSLWSTFQPMILQQNHRQGNIHEFSLNFRILFYHCFSIGSANEWANRLNRFREGLVTEEDLEVLKGRITSDCHLSKDALHIFYTNVEVSEHNDRMLNTLPAL